MLFSDGSITGVFEIVCAFGRGKEVEEITGLPPCGLDGSGRCVAHQMLELGEDLLDRIEIGTVGRQEQQVRADGTDRLASCFAFVGAEIVEDNDVALGQGRDQNLFHIGCEDIAVDRPVDHPWRVDAVMAQGSDEREGLPVPEWHARIEPLSARAPAAQGGHVGLDPRLVEENQASGINPALIGLPTRPLAGDIRM